MDRKSTQVVNTILALHCVQKGIKNTKAEVGKFIGNYIATVEENYKNEQLKPLYDELLKTVEDKGYFGKDLPVMVNNPKWNYEDEEKRYDQWKMSLGYTVSVTEANARKTNGDPAFAKVDIGNYELKYYGDKHRYNEKGESFQDSKYERKDWVKSKFYIPQYIESKNPIYSYANVVGGGFYEDFPKSKVNIPSLKDAKVYTNNDPDSGLIDAVNTEIKNTSNKIEALKRANKLKADAESAQGKIDAGLVAIDIKNIKEANDILLGVKNTRGASLVSYKDVNGIAEWALVKAIGNNASDGKVATLERDSKLDTYYTKEQIKHIFKTYTKEVISVLSSYWEDDLVRAWASSNITLDDYYDISYNDKVGVYLRNYHGTKAIQFYMEHKDAVKYPTPDDSNYIYIKSPFDTKTKADYYIELVEKW